MDRTQLGVVCKSPRATPERQLTALRKAGAQRIVEIGQASRTWRDAVATVRPGDTVYVYALVMIPTKRGDDELQPGAQVSEFILEVHERGGTVVEVYTGRNSRDAKQRRAMVKDAHKSVRHGARELPDMGLGPGRPKTQWPSEEVKAAAIAIWKSPDFSSRKAAERNMPKGVNSTLIRTLGRWPGKKRRKKR